MKAIVLVGGYGTRLRPLTLTRPKQMLPILDRPMIEWVVERLVAVGVSDVVLSLGYLPDRFTAAYPDGVCAGAKLHYAVEPEPLDTAGAIRYAALHGGLDCTEGPFLVLNGDVIADLDLGALMELHQARAATATIALTKVDDPSQFGVVPIRADGSVVAFVEKPPAEQAPTQWINAGAYVCDPAVLGRIPDGRKVSIERETFPALAAERRLYARHDHGYWIDAGTPASYLAVQLELARRCGDGSAGGTSGRAGPASYVHPTAWLEPDAAVERSVIMARASVHAGARVTRSVLLPGASVARGATVTDSVLGHHASVTDACRLAECTVLGDGTHVSAGELVGARVAAMAPSG